MGLIEYNIDQLPDDTVQHFGQKTAVVYQEDAYTWRQVDLLAVRIADRLEDLGFAEGNHVGLWSGNSAAWGVTFLSLQKLDAVSALLNSNYQKRELEQIIRISQLRWLCCGSTPALTQEPDLIRTVTKNPAILFSLVIFHGQIVGTREGTILSALLTGTVVKFYQKYLAEPMKKCFVHRKEAVATVQLS